MMKYSRNSLSPNASRLKPANRCAIYTRKSCEEGLELEFNSLHAQRESAEAFIASQQHEGWETSAGAMAFWEDTLGENRKAAVIEVKASQSSRFVTSLYQKYKSEDTQSPDFWVLHSLHTPASLYAASTARTRATRPAFLRYGSESSRVSGFSAIPRDTMLSESKTSGEARV